MDKYVEVFNAAGQGVRFTRASHTFITFLEASKIKNDKKIREDSKKFYHFFFWNGSIPKSRLGKWLSSEQLAVPEDLIELWEEFGGGDFFDSETILSPFGDIVLGDDVTGATEFPRVGRGMIWITCMLGSAVL